MGTSMAWLSREPKACRCIDVKATYDFRASISCGDKGRRRIDADENLLMHLVMHCGWSWAGHDSSTYRHIMLASVANREIRRVLEMPERRAIDFHSSSDGLA